MTRFNYYYDGSGACSMTLDRDLIRIPIEFGASNQLPTASFWLDPALVQTGQPVTFNASESSDSDGIIKKYEWDFDENGSFEVDSGLNPIVTHSFPSAANTVTVKLRVTDNRGGTSETTRTMGVVGDPQNQVPTASFTAPSVVLSGDLASFDGSASSDTDGSITNYKWDLDGNGSFETDTGSTALTSHTYTTTGTVTVRLRVTDSGGATGETSRTVTVNAPAAPSPTASPATPAPITAPPQAVFPPAASTGQSTSALPACSSIRRQRRKLISKRAGIRRKLVKANTGTKKRHYGAQVRALNRKISKLAKTRCSA
jgi:PKD repeat protein